jgi:hypothetical protein
MSGMTPSLPPNTRHGWKLTLTNPDPELVKNCFLRQPNSFAIPA